MLVRCRHGQLRAASPVLCARAGDLRGRPSRDAGCSRPAGFVPAEHRRRRACTSCAADLSETGLDVALEGSPFRSRPPGLLLLARGVDLPLPPTANLATLGAIAPVRGGGQRARVQLRRSEPWTPTRRRPDAASARARSLRSASPGSRALTPTGSPTTCAAPASSSLENLGPEQLGARYCSGRSDGLAPASGATSHTRGSPAERPGRSGRAQRPVKRGVRRSAVARTPSWKSSVANSSACCAPSRRSPPARDRAARHASSGGSTSRPAARRRRSRRRARAPRCAAPRRRPGDRRGRARAPPRP